MVNTFKYDFMDDVKRIKENSDIVIVYPHWGVEYTHLPNDRQRELKDKLFEAGADVILGSHSHVLQSSEDFEINGERKFVIYSMGNALSNQRQEFVHHEGVETGCMVKLNILKNNDTNKTTLKDIKLIPTYVNRYWDSGRLIYNIVKLEDYKDGGKLAETVDAKTKEFYLNKLNMANEVLKGGEDGV
ncbi:CapA family protein [Peptoniphilus sp.]|uniref:CapA family protein n=1 Tax=Peptoniphilus sp. TaxID=1971214 RepID=UPI003D8E29B2